MGSLTKGLIGKQDLEIQYNTNATESFDRIVSTGSTLALSKFPDIWDGLGKINVAKIETSQTDPGNITETVALGTLTHEVLKIKINSILTILRNLEII